MPTHKKFPALGRGLDALIKTEEVRTQGAGSINNVALDKIRPNPNQPRREFDPQALQELSDSIGEIGLVTPITLRDMGDGSYVIIAGERRWRASQMAGLVSVPAYIRTVDDENMMEMALVENIQREDLNPMEIALAYQHLLEQYEMTQERLSERVGKSRSAVTNYLRLLKLPANIQIALEAKELDMGHARALLALNDPQLQNQVFRQIKQEGLSVRRVEEIVKSLLDGEGVKTKDGQRLKGKKTRLSTEYVELRNGLSTLFGSKVQLTCSETGRGKITIPFASESELERLMLMFDQLKR
ncbi:MAG: ParB/RepB/Spo0J family partition protein [Bacteroidaceae bacterium]|nr:ParB/RepB/Spo0J family partition protein [Prevotellaceae bacterium]MDY5632764.1 ParB/RepB/Spo0J family partition protein [Bacteroidaceae bacterium]